MQLLRVTVALLLLALPRAVSAQWIEVLPTNGVLHGGDALLSPDERYELTLIPDGNLVLTVEGHAIRATNTGGPGTWALAMQASDGNLVLYQDGAPAWASDTSDPSQNALSQLELGNDGDLLIRRPDGSVALHVWNTVGAAPPAGWLGAGGRLGPNEEVVSANGRFRLRNQANGRLVLLRDGWFPLWSSAPGSGAPGVLHMQRSDGNLVLERNDGSYWSPQTEGHPGAYLQVEDNGNVVIYDLDRNVLWQTGTANAAPQAPALTINGRGQNEHVYVEPGAAFTVRVDNLPPGGGYTVQVFVPTDCCIPLRYVNAEAYVLPDQPYTADVPIQGITQPPPAMYGFYDVFLVYCCPEPQLPDTEQDRVTWGPRIHLRQPTRIEYFGMGPETGETLRVRHGDPMRFRVRNPTGHRLDRVGLFLEGASDSGEPFYWIYSNNQRVPPVNGRDDDYDIDIDTHVPGDRYYVLRYFPGTGGGHTASGHRLYVHPEPPGFEFEGQPASTNPTFVPGTPFRLRVLSAPTTSSWWLERWIHDSCCNQQPPPDFQAHHIESNPGGWWSFTAPDVPNERYEICLVHTNPETVERESIGCAIFSTGTSPASTPRLIINSKTEGETLEIEPNTPLQVRVVNATVASGDRVRLTDTGNNETRLFVVSPATKEVTIPGLSLLSAPSSNTYTTRFYANCASTFCGGTGIVGPIVVVRPKASIRITVNGSDAPPAIASGASFFVDIEGDPIAATDTLYYVDQDTKLRRSLGQLGAGLQRHFVVLPLQDGAYRPELYAAGATTVAKAIGPTIEVGVRPGVDSVYYYDLDAIGSVRQVTNTSNAVIERSDFQPFGVEHLDAVNATPAQRLEFAGKERDADVQTRLDYFGARYYASQTGRFITVDPALQGEPALVNPQLWNRYSYALNNPLKFADPDGRNPLVVGGAIGAGVFAAWTAYQNVQQGRPWYESIGVEAGKGFLIGATLGLAAPAAAGVTAAEFGVLTASGTALVGNIARADLDKAMKAGGTTVELVTKLTQAPAAGRALSTAIGDGARALADASRSVGQLYGAQIPKHVLDMLERAGMAQRIIVQMNGQRGIEYRIRPEAMDYLAQYFEQLP